MSAPGKHIWATILAADAGNYFTAITRLNPRDISFDELPADEREEEDEEPLYRPLAPVVPFFKLEPEAPTPGWRKRLNEIVPAGSLAHTAWPRNASCSTSWMCSTVSRADP